MLEGTFITEKDGTQVQVTDYAAALKQAKEAIAWHEEREKAYQTDNEVLYFPQAHEEWKHTLLELEKLAIKSPHLANQ